MLEDIQGPYTNFTDPKIKDYIDKVERNRYSEEPFSFLFENFNLEDYEGRSQYVQHEFSTKDPSKAVEEYQAYIKQLKTYLARVVSINRRYDKALNEFLKPLSTLQNPNDPYPVPSLELHLPIDIKKYPQIAEENNLLFKYNSKGDLETFGWLKRTSNTLIDLMYSIGNVSFEKAMNGLNSIPDDVFINLLKIHSQLFRKRKKDFEEKLEGFKNKFMENVQKAVEEGYLKVDMKLVKEKMKMLRIGFQDVFSELRYGSFIYEPDDVGRYHPINNINNSHEIFLSSDIDPEDWETVLFHELNHAVISGSAIREIDQGGVNIRIRKYIQYKSGLRFSLKDRMIVNLLNEPITEINAHRLQTGMPLNVEEVLKRKHSYDKYIQLIRLLQSKGIDLQGIIDAYTEEKIIDEETGEGNILKNTQKLLRMFFDKLGISLRVLDELNYRLGIDNILILLKEDKVVLQTLNELIRKKILTYDMAEEYRKNVNKLIEDIKRYILDKETADQPFLYEISEKKTDLINSIPDDIIFNLRQLCHSPIEIEISETEKIEIQISSIILIDDGKGSIQYLAFYDGPRDYEYDGAIDNAVKYYIDSILDTFQNIKKKNVVGHKDYIKYKPDYGFARNIIDHTRIWNDLGVRNDRSNVSIISIDENEKAKLDLSIEKDGLISLAA